MDLHEGREIVKRKGKEKTKQDKVIDTTRKHYCWSNTWSIQENENKGSARMWPNHNGDDKKWNRRNSKENK